MSKLKTYITLLLFMCIGARAHAQQQDVELHPGDTLTFEGCGENNFEYIDHYIKTRYTDSASMQYDSKEMWEFYNTFFTDGDFDFHRLPCSYEGKKAVIKHMMAVETDTGEYQTIVLAMFDDKTVAYIIDEAFSSGEVVYIPK